MSESYLVLVQYVDVHHARLLLERLRDAEISAMLIDSESGEVLLPGNEPAGLARLVIHDEDRDRARAVLDALEEEQERELETNQHPPWTCPGCSEKLGQEFDVCWNCQTPYDPQFHRPPDSSDDPLVDPNSGDGQIFTAWLCALAGLVTVPVVLHLYSLWLLYQLPQRPLKLSQKSQRRASTALAINLLVILAALLWLVWLYFASRTRIR